MMKARVHIVHIVGARPNFVKLAPVYAALAATGQFAQRVVHTGQHYDAEMSGIFFEQFGLPAPDVNLGVHGGTSTEQVARVMLALEPVLKERRPDWLLVYGDVNATAAAALVGANLQIPLAHVEAGLRSQDWTMPEEINRIVTDRLAALYYTPSADADAHLQAEGVPDEKIVCVGNVMIDTLERFLPIARQRQLFPRPSRYILVTLHRPSNVDDPAQLATVLDTLVQIAAQQLPIVLPLHPRTAARLEALNWHPTDPSRLLRVPPQGYLEFLRLQAEATLVLTDSGGVQEETTALGIPCITLRPNTERPVTVTEGTNSLFHAPMAELPQAVADKLRVFEANPSARRRPALWDGHAAERLAADLELRS